MYLVDAGTLVRLGDKVLHHLKGGDLFGESSLLFRRPRISTIECSSAECHLHEMKSSDFYDMLEADPGSARALRELCRTRMFQRATKTYLIKQSRSLRNEDFIKAFHEQIQTILALSALKKSEISSKIWETLKFLKKTF